MNNNMEIPITPEQPGLPPVSQQHNMLSHFTVFGLVLLGFIAFVPLVFFFFSPLVLAATFASIFYPFYKVLYYRLWRNGPMASILCCLLLVLCVLIPVYAIIQLVIEQAILLYKSAAPMVQEMMGAFPIWGRFF